MPVLRHLRIRISEDEVYRFLGYRPGQQPQPRLREAIAWQIKSAYNLVQPQAVYDLVRVECQEDVKVELAGGYHLSVGSRVQEWQGAEYLALSICTIGLALEGEVARLLASGDLSAATFLDSAGSVATESLAQIVYSHLCHLARRMGMDSGPRLSPGHGEWPLGDQEQVFKLLHPETIGINLNRSYVMLPLKSVSFATGVGRGLKGERDKPCVSCEMEDCSYRR